MDAVRFCKYMIDEPDPKKQIIINVGDRLMIAVENAEALCAMAKGIEREWVAAAFPDPAFRR